jgi:ribosomal RNA-processing protein 9
MGYVETLFGHQDTILCLDALRGETAVTAGARDRTIRFWKIADESQLVFRGGGRSAIRELLEGGAFDGHEDEEHMNGVEVDGPKSSKGKEKMKESKYAEGSIECVAMIDETTFVSGGDTGYVARYPMNYAAEYCPKLNMSLEHPKEKTCIHTDIMPWVPRSTVLNRGARAHTPLDNGGCITALFRHVCFW